jgi:TROVE domain-containing protein
MVKFNKPAFNAAKQGTPIAIKTGTLPTGRTHNNAPGFERDAKSELFLLAVSQFYGEDTFYETSSLRDDRFRNLVAQVARSDADWLRRFLPWLRNVANIRTASIVGAIEAARAMAKAGIPGGRGIVAEAMSRADEPGEALAYYVSRYGRSLPKPIKRGIADAVGRLYTQYSALKYDTDSKGYRFADVLELTHAAPVSLDQGQLFKWLLARRHRRTRIEVGDDLEMVAANAYLRRRAATDVKALLNETQLRLAGMTWEDVLSLGGNRIDKKALWTAVIPTMGYMGLLRNLRNFDEAGISGDLVDTVRERLASPAEVAKSRQLPMRFLSAHREVSSNNWSLALERALEASLVNVPKLDGSTLVLIDTSGSMAASMAGKSKLQRWDTAVIFGLAVAHANAAADVVSFSDSSKVFPAKAGESLLRSIDRWKSGGYFIGNGTATEAAVRKHYRGHDTVLILTDEQANYHDHYDVAAAVPKDKTVITFNLAGDKYGHTASGADPRRVTVGGLSDAAFKLLPSLAARAQGGWPF